MKKNNALIIMAKYPHKDYVKTRFKGHISDEKRLELYIYLLKNTIQKLREIPGTNTFITYSPQSAKDYFLQFGLGIFPQHDGDLGYRMFQAINKILNEGYEKSVLVGVDIPEISGSIVLKAFELLSQSDIVFGPARDGGYYLVGLKKPFIEIFQNIKWSTHNTLKQSTEKAADFGYSVALTETLSDIDKIEDLENMGLS